MNQLLKLFIAILLTIGTPLAFADEPHAFGGTDDTDVWPWPWGQECPFPWANIEGLWKIKSDPAVGYFRFKVRSDVDGVRLIEVEHLNELKVMAAKGTGYSPVGQKIVRAAIHSTVNGRNESFWLYVRAYQMDKKMGCNGGIQTVVTVRPISGGLNWELNYEVERVLFQPL